MDKIKTLLVKKSRLIANGGHKKKCGQETADNDYVSKFDS